MQYLPGIVAVLALLMITAVRRYGRGIQIGPDQPQAWRAALSMMFLKRFETQPLIHCLV